ncbi:PilT protein domain protein [Thermodesulfobacterium geofontis OPF15]|uniref:Ribonuclease VapC n=1 Tax=Thermodesulfobacterium geofontis (strain OPF15) TaxID=795359 RepID=F8C3L4_THEGP|nr:PIN domain-containing protein [Thermodesulfobacterium geofontis]AEH22463.1 PilT protein domain protein [Thermodesulfobacterium geofontis OPF15]
MYLLDTNIFLELILDQEKADDVEKFLRSAQKEKLYISEFSLYSVGIILFRQKLYDIFIRFVDDLIFTYGIHLVKLAPKDIKQLVEVAKQFNLDFDDAYQYTIAELYDLKIVSFDSDFDRTKRGRKTPEDILKEFKL